MLRLDAVRIDQGAFSLSADLAVAAGSCVAVMGPSGAGKSTLLSAIAGFVPVAAGRISCSGDEIGQARPQDRPVTMLFQDGNLFAHLTVAQNVGLALDPGLKLTPDDHDRVSEGLARAGLAGMGDRLPPSLSGGQQSRAALARALLRGKPMLLLDEPFAALGPALRAEMLDLVAEICAQRAMTLLMVTHEPRDALRISDQTILVADSIAAPPMGTKALLANPPPSLRSYLGA